MLIPPPAPRCQHDSLLCGPCILYSFLCHVGSQPLWPTRSVLSPNRIVHFLRSTAHRPTAVRENDHNFPSQYSRRDWLVNTSQGAGAIQTIGESSQTVRDRPLVGAQRVMETGRRLSTLGKNRQDPSRPFRAFGKQLGCCPIPAPADLATSFRWFSREGTQGAMRLRSMRGGPKSMDTCWAAEPRCKERKGGKRKAAILASRSA